MVPLQSDNLIMVGLGVLHDVPPHPVQPPLRSGIHLRWQPGPDNDFPWYGYYLFRRKHGRGELTCLSSSFDPEWRPGNASVSQLAISNGVLSSDTALALTENFAAASAREFDLSGRSYVRFALDPGRSARRFEIKLGFDDGRAVEDTKEGKDRRPDEEHRDERELAGEGLSDQGRRDPQVGQPLDLRLRPMTPGQGRLRIGRPVMPPATSSTMTVVAYDDGVPVQTAQVSGSAGRVVTVVLEADRMDAVRIASGPAVLIDICYVLTDHAWNVGWEEIPSFTYPMCLPTAEGDYPCPEHPASDVDAESLAQQRIQYGLASSWPAAAIQELREACDGLTSKGPPPSGLSMASRTGIYADSLNVGPNTPKMPDQRPLDLVMLGAINPAIAQMVGIYFIDDPEAPAPGPSTDAYDYLLLADHTGLYQGKASVALAALANPLPADIDGWICFGLRKQAAQPLPVPTQLKAFALPGAATNPALIAADKVNAAGLHWKLEQTADGDLLPDAHVGFHIWRADLAMSAPTAAVPQASYKHITPNRMAMVAVPDGAPAAQQHASGWPPYPLHKIDAGLTEGWYAYVIRGMDIFGRISEPSDPASWRQWGPEPNPRPWYYVNPAGDAEINPWAVLLLDKTPPPAVPGVQAWTLDPLDPGLEDGPNGVYHAWNQIGWWTSLPTADKPRLAGVRVRFRWDVAQMLAAPRTVEFRIYVSPGTNPVTDYHEALNWPERMFVVDVDPPLTTPPTPPSYIEVFDNGVLLGRQYEVLLPFDAPSALFPELVMHPTDANPVVYANVAVTAADDRTHTVDDAKWASGLWGGRTGNEGPVGAPAKITRVLRSPPPAPELIGADDKLWATRADYQGISRYTVHWVKPAGINQKVHIFQAVDDALFRFDWERRRHTGAHTIAATDVAPFAALGSWNATEEGAVLTELTTDLDAVKALDFDTNAPVRAAYEALSERALRVLASLLDNAEAFVQTTWQPLDPAAPSSADSAGPDGASTYAPNSNWGAWVAELDGRASNRYFFRYAYVNSAHDVGPLGPSTPAIYMPKVDPPRRPAITRVESGQLAITLAWAHNRELDFAQFRLYRADNERQARDRRLMNLVASIPKAAVKYALAEVEFTDTADLAGGRTYWYVLTSADTEGNESLESDAVVAMAADTRQPAAPTWRTVERVLRETGTGQLAPWPTDGFLPAGFAPAARLQWSRQGDSLLYSVTVRRAGEQHWSPVTSAGPPVPLASMPMDYQYLDLGVSASGEGRSYRVAVRAPTGRWSSPSVDISLAPTDALQEAP